MGTVASPPRGAKSPLPVRWDDADNVRLWLTALRDAANDVVAAGDDATRPQEARVLSRAEARRRITGAGQALDALLDAGERSLAPPATPAP